MRWIRHQRHESPESLYAYSEGMLEPQDRERVEGHLVRCPVCAGQVLEFRRLRVVLATPEPGPDRLRNAIQVALAQTAAAGTEIRRRDPGGKEREMPNEAVMEPVGRRAYTRRSFWRIAVPLATAVCLGALAGVWVSNQNRHASYDAFPFYEQAQKAYNAGRTEAAVAAVEKALKGRLRLQDPPFRQYAVLRDIARKNTAFAVSLARRRQTREALRVNSLTPSIGDQLIEDRTLLSALVAAALYHIADDNKSKIYEAAGDDRAAKRAAEEFQKKRLYFNEKLKPRIQAMTQSKTRDTKEEQKLVKEIAAAWK